MRQLNKFIFALFFFFLFISSYRAKSDYAYLDIQLPNISAKNILLYNLNDHKILYEQNSNEKISIASLTKIMTALLAIENFDNLEKVVSVPKGAFYNVTGYAEAGFKVGDYVTIKDLLYGTLLPSGADAAQTLAILTSGNISSFVAKMNEKAISLGMNETHYENPVGRDNEQNYSTLRDLAKLLFYALENPTFYSIYTTRQYITLNNLELSSTLVMPSTKYNLNIENIKGSKSGYTRNAGLCLSSIAEFHGVKYLLITANSTYENGFPNHIVDSLAIYNYFFDHFSYQPILKKGEVLHTLEIEDGFLKTYEIKSEEDQNLYLENESEVEYVYHGIEHLNYKVKTKDKLGEIEVKYKDKVIDTFEVFLNEDIEYKHTKIIVLGIFILLIITLLCFLYKKRKRNRK